MCFFWRSLPIEVPQNNLSTQRNWQEKRSPPKLPSLANFAQCHLRQNWPLWWRIRNDNTTFSRHWHWQYSCTGASLAHVTTSRKWEVLNSPQWKLCHRYKNNFIDHGKSSAVITGSDPTQWVRANAANQGCPSLSQKPPNTPSTSPIMWEGFAGLCRPWRITTGQINDFSSWSGSQPSQPPVLKKGSSSKWRLKHLAFPNPYFRKCPLLALFYVMGLATATVSPMNLVSSDWFSS